MHADPAVLMQTVAVAVILGMAAQIFAHRFKLPAILPLLVLGVVAGPFGIALLAPESLGSGLEVFIELGVAVILFEGGLSLDPGQLRRVGAPVRNLLTIGVALTGVGAAWLAQAVTGMPWTTAALFGAVVTVTGPTVIVPLLRHMIAPRRVRTVLVSEGLIVDPIGAVLAYLVLQWIERAEQPPQALLTELLVLAATGAALGFVAGSLAKIVARSRWVGRELRNLVILAVLFGCFVLAERIAPQSGILAAVVMGLTVSVAGIPDLMSLRNFKEQLTVLLISVLFVLLAARLDLIAIYRLGWGGVAVAFGLILLIRPAAVFASVWPGQLDMKERLVLALTAPRGIVAAAVASLAAIELRAAGIAGAAELEGLVYLVILLTGAWATAMAVVLPRLLGYTSDPSRRLTVLVGANALAGRIAGILSTRGRKVVVVDAVGWKLDELRRAGVLTVRGDARNASTYERAGVERDTHVVTLTTNDELNLLVAELVRDEFGVEHPVVALQSPPEELGSVRRAWVDLLGWQRLRVPRWIRWAEEDLVRGVTVDLEIDGAREAVAALGRERAEESFLLCAWAGDAPDFHPSIDELDSYERATVLALEGEAGEALAPYAWQGEEEEEAAAAEAGVSPAAAVPPSAAGSRSGTPAPASGE